ncbi:MAG: ABC transporter permease subunit [Armatimonadota bacterium]
MRKIIIIASMSVLENSRKHIFHVICLLMLAIIAGSTLLTILTEGVKIKILKDLCMTSISFGGAMLAIALASGAIPQDVESRIIYPVIARPVTRNQYLLGKFFGVLVTVTIGILVMTAIFSALIFINQGTLDLFLFTAIAYLILQTAVIAGATIMISTFTSSAIAALIAFLIFITGTIKIGYFGGLLNRMSDGFSKGILTIIYYMLPNLESFNLKDAFVHSEHIPMIYLLQVGIYGILFTAFLLVVGSIVFSHKEV